MLAKYFALDSSTSWVLNTSTTALGCPLLDNKISERTVQRCLDCDGIPGYTPVAHTLKLTFPEVHERDLTAPSGAMHAWFNDPNGVGPFKLPGEMELRVEMQCTLGR